MKKYDDWISSKVSVNDHAIHKNGLFANQKINKGETVLIYGGYLTSSLISWLSHILVGDYGWQISSNQFLVPLTSQDIDDADHINHSCDPNLGCKDERALLALRDIQPGEELTFDYAMVTTDEPFSFLAFLFPYRFKCNCGAENCRKIVKGTDWKRDDLQKRYSGFFSPYLTEKIENLKLKKTIII